MTNLMVLVVDDNLVNRLLPSFILRPFGQLVQVIECETGADALRMLEEQHVTHVLLDISMPDLDGVEVVMEIRRLAKFAGLKVIAYTADALAVHALHLESIGFDGVLLKPLKSEDLIEVLGIGTQMQPSA